MSTVAQEGQNVLPTDFTTIYPVQCFSCGRVISGDLAKRFRALRDRYIQEFRSVAGNPQYALQLLGKAEYSNLTDRQMKIAANERALNEVHAYRLCDRTRLLNPQILPGGLAYSNPNAPRVVQLFKDFGLDQSLAEEASRRYFQLISVGADGVPQTLSQSPANAEELLLLETVYPDLTPDEKAYLVNNRSITNQTVESEQFLSKRLNVPVDQLIDILQLSGFWKRPTSLEQRAARRPRKPALQGLPRVPGQSALQIQTREETILENASLLYRAQNELKRLIERRRETQFQRGIANKLLQETAGSVEHLQEYGRERTLLEAPEDYVNVIQYIGTENQQYLRTVRDPNMNYLSRARNVLSEVATAGISTRIPAAESQMKVMRIGDYVDEDNDEVMKKIEEEFHQEMLTKQGVTTAPPEPDLNAQVAAAALAPQEDPFAASMSYQFASMNLGAPSGPAVYFGGSTYAVPNVASGASTGSTFPSVSTGNSVSNILPGAPPGSFGAPNLGVNVMTGNVSAFPPNLTFQGVPTPSLTPVGYASGPTVGGVFPGQLNGNSVPYPNTLQTIPSTGYPTLGGQLPNWSYLGGGSGIVTNQ